MPVTLMGMTVSKPWYDGIVPYYSRENGLTINTFTVAFAVVLLLVWIL
jgi:hypothetical protein